MKTTSEKAFVDTCISVYDELRSYDAGSNYLSDSHVIEYPDGTKKWVVSGHYHDTIRVFDHEPTRAEINNAIVLHFNMHSRFYIR